LEVADRAELHKQDLIKVACDRPEIKEQLLRELETLRFQLTGLSHAFDHQIDALGDLCREVNQASASKQDEPKRNMLTREIVRKNPA
jgi:hypothetical protein